MKYTLYVKKNGPKETGFAIISSHRTELVTNFIDIEAKNLEEAETKAIALMSSMINEDTNIYEAKLFLTQEHKELIKAANDIFTQRWQEERKQKMREQLAYLKKELGEE